VSEAQKYEKALYKGSKRDGVSSHLHCNLNLIRRSCALVLSTSGKTNQLNSKRIMVGERGQRHTMNIKRDHISAMDIKRDHFSAMDGALSSHEVDGSSDLWAPEAMNCL